MAEETAVKDELVVSLEYTLRVEGEVIDATDASQGEAIQFIQGGKTIIPGLERELYGMTIGESKQVTVSPGDAYGEVDPGAFITLGKSDIPDTIPLEAGTELELRDQSGERLLGRIAEITGDQVRLDFNHPLAGKTLEFEVKVVALRPATPEELAHGHVHGSGGH